MSCDDTVNVCKLRCTGDGACKSGICCKATSCDVQGAINTC
jgi:hypothetical protein